MLIILTHIHGNCLHFCYVFIIIWSLKGVTGSATKTTYSKYLENGTQFLNNCWTKSVWNDKTFHLTSKTGVAFQIRGQWGSKAFKWWLLNVRYFVINSRTNYVHHSVIDLYMAIVHTFVTCFGNLMGLKSEILIFNISDWRKFLKSDIQQKMLKYV